MQLNIICTSNKHQNPPLPKCVDHFCVFNQSWIRCRLPHTHLPIKAVTSVPDGLLHLPRPRVFLRRNPRKSRRRDSYPMATLAAAAARKVSTISRITNPGHAASLIPRRGLAGAAGNFFYMHLKRHFFLLDSCLHFLIYLKFVSKISQILISFTLDQPQHRCFTLCFDCILGFVCSRAVCR